VLCEDGLGVDGCATAGVDLKMQVRPGDIACSPAETAIRLWWQYQTSVPSRRVMIVRLP
jgi:hypothetical protein